MSLSYCFVVLSVIFGICRILHWHDKNLTSAETQNGQCPTAEGAMSTYEHSGAFSGSGKQQEATSKHAWEAKWRCTSQKEELWSHSMQKKWTQIMQNNSPSYSMLRHGNWSKENELLGTQQYAPCLLNWSLNRQKKKKGGKQINCITTLLNRNHKSTVTGQSTRMYICSFS